jgi:hypothetical protein
MSRIGRPKSAVSSTTASATIAHSMIRARVSALYTAHRPEQTVGVPFCMRSTRAPRSEPLTYPSKAFRLPSEGCGVFATCASIPRLQERTRASEEDSPILSERPHQDDLSASAEVRHAAAVEKAVGSDPVVAPGDAAAQGQLGFTDDLDLLQWDERFPTSKRGTVTRPAVRCLGTLRRRFLPPGQGSTLLPVTKHRCDTKCKGSQDLIDRFARMGLTIIPRGTHDATIRGPVWPSRDRFVTRALPALRAHWQEIVAILKAPALT